MGVAPKDEASDEVNTYVCDPPWPAVIEVEPDFTATVTDADAGAVENTLMSIAIAVKPEYLRSPLRIICPSILSLSGARHHSPSHGLLTNRRRRI